MLNHIIRILSVSCVITYISPAFSVSNAMLHTDSLVESIIKQLPPGFTNLEHKTLGDHVALQWAPFATQPRLQLANGLLLSYGEIIMFGGDLFGDPVHPIAMCKADLKKTCFMKQFEALAAPSPLPESDCHNPIYQVEHINVYLNDLQHQLDEAQAQGIASWEFYQKNNMTIAKQLNRITCGGSFIHDFIPLGQFLLLAQVNLDHFVPDALHAYETGHTVALETAIEAHNLLLQNAQEKALQTLQTAYAQNAFACHFLSDAMSSGHMRVPRRAMHYGIDLPMILNLLLANLMHEEDSILGLQVINHEGLQWKALGDGYTTHPEAKTQQDVLNQILQRSADHVYDAFISGKMPHTYDEMQLLPNYDQLNNNDNHAALFKFENNKLLKRNQNHNPMDYHWLESWSPILTLLDFQIF